ncbi:hypothetical protein [Vibrio sp. R78045]|uniref:hypothetical protein n=1 Tax=Vibrio sp. R78045 TaxID=3093868 RepID=UPI0036F35F9E
MSDSHHENKSAKIFIVDYPAVIPLVPLGFFPSVERFQIYLAFLVLMAVLGLLNIRTSTIIKKAWAKLKGKTMYARLKNNR